MIYRPILCAAFFLAAACGDNQPPAPRPPAAAPWTYRPLIADGPPTVTGGRIENSVFTNVPTHAGCLEPSPPHCVSYTAHLPSPPPGWELQVAPVLPVLSLTGRPRAFAAVDLPSCEEPLLAEVLYSTDRWIWKISLPAAPFIVPRGATQLDVALCVRGEIRVQLGELSGALTSVHAPR